MQSTYDLSGVSAATLISLNSDLLSFPAQYILSKLLLNHAIVNKTIPTPLHGISLKTNIE